MATPATPTWSLDLWRVYDHFDRRLFAGKLPRCQILFQRMPTCHGRYNHSPCEGVDTITLDLDDRADAEILATLAHEMVHLWQYHFGSPGRNGHHNEAWADKMEEIGLMPSDTGSPGGRRTGRHVGHYVIAGGPFDLACSELLVAGNFGRFE